MELLFIREWMGNYWIDCLILLIISMSSNWLCLQTPKNGGSQEHVGVKNFFLLTNKIIWKPFFNIYSGDLYPMLKIGLWSEI